MGKLGNTLLHHNPIHIFFCILLCNLIPGFNQQYKYILSHSSAALLRISCVFFQMIDRSQQHEMWYQRLWYQCPGKSAGFPQIGVEGRELPIGLFGYMSPPPQPPENEPTPAKQKHTWFIMFIWLHLTQSVGNSGNLSSWKFHYT